MGKGLSKLQKGLLLIAIKNVGRMDGIREKSLEVRTGRDKNPKWAINIGSLPHLTTHEALQGCTHAAGRVTMSRAFKRLEGRGLAERFYSQTMAGHILWTGINLTLKGQEIAKKLMVNTLTTVEGY